MEITLMELILIGKDFAKVIVWLIIANAAHPVGNNGQ